MTVPENFVSRWARLKSESDAEPKTELVGYGSRPEASADTETPSVQQRDEVVDDPFDPASLPSIETITVDTDIRGFLQSRVPAALTRAALRQVWASDPAIRDFVGIAENQWNFNDHSCIPGFGPLEAADDLVARALESLTNVAQETPQDAAGAEQAALPGGEPVEALRPAAPLPIIEKTPGIVATAGATELAGGELGSGAAVPGSHGGALPQ